MYKLSPSYIVERAYEEFFDALSDAIYREEVDKVEMFSYLQKYHGDIYDEWVQWYEQGDM